MSAWTEYVNVARFDAVDWAEVVAAALVCPWCLVLPPLGGSEAATDQSSVELTCVACDATWTVVVSGGQLLRLLLAPPPNTELSE